MWRQPWYDMAKNSEHPLFENTSKNFPLTLLE
jgi:regulation of enolase protein 1 (concanavalin A-like superfamily)